MNRINLERMLFVLIMTCFTLSCSPKLEFQENSFHPTTETKASSSSNRYIYNASAKVWMLEQEDPYEISHIMAIARSQYDNARVYATHYALKLFPRNEKELNEITHIDDIMVSYIPFGYTYASQDEINTLSPMVLNSTKCYHEEERYYIEYEDSSDLQPLPVLYVAWNVSKPLPEKYDYTILYEACLPNTESVLPSNSNDGVQIATSLRGSSNRTITGRIRDYDDLLSSYISVKRLKLRLSYGLSSIETTTDAGGYFSFTGNINDNATIKIIYENDQFRITNGGTITYAVSLGTVQDNWGASSNKNFYTNTPFQAVHCATDYFYNGSHSISTPSTSYALRISMDSFSDPWSGRFNYYPIVPPYINVNIQSYYDDADYVGNVLHELGHFNHYQINGGYSYYSGVPSLIRESYAVFVAWHLSREYYTALHSNQYVSSWDDSLARGYQYWTGTTDYSPLFVDLADDFNQNSYISENILDTPTSTIINFVKDKQSWAGLRIPLKNYLNSHYSSTQTNSYLSPYDSYFGYSGN